VTKDDMLLLLLRYMYGYGMTQYGYGMQFTDVRYLYLDYVGYDVQVLSVNYVQFSF